MYTQCIYICIYIYIYINYKLLNVYIHTFIVYTSIVHIVILCNNTYICIRMYHTYSNIILQLSGAAVYSNIGAPQQ